MFDKIKNVFRIEITQGMEHHSSLMNIYDKDSFFYHSYQQAAYAISKIVEVSRFESEERRKWKECWKYRYDFEYHNNNIVAFCADRGQGKTSAMLSVAEALRSMSAEKDERLEKKREQEKMEFWESAYNFFPDSSKDSRNPVLDTHFECLPVIDPTCLEKSDSILRTIISKMFRSASQKWQNDSYCSSLTHTDAGREKQHLKEELANKFLQCFKGVDYLYKEGKKEISSYYDDLNMVAAYGDSNNFKTLFIELVELYLKFMSFSGCNAQNTMMVILIDDADLNTKRAFSIVEEIQKYFVIPGVLILMALHVGTLARTLEQNQIEQYKTLIDYSSDPTIRERCHRAMERYIEKLFPSAHRVYLPEISKIIEQNYNSVELYYLDRNGNNILEKYSYLLKDDKKCHNYEDILFVLLYVKTGIILAKRENHLHEFLPRNFRQLNHFLFYLNSMEDIVNRENFSSLFENILKVLVLPDESNVLRDTSPLNISSTSREHSTKAVFLWLKNLNIFQGYFLKAWCPERLSLEQLRIINDINKTPSNIKNFNTVQIIRNVINSNKDKPEEHIPDIREQPITNSQYTPMSDVIWALYLLEHSVDQLNRFSLIYAVRMYYTIYLHITAMQAVLYSLESKNISFDSLFNVLGGRIFPMHYYMQKRLPFYIFRKHSVTETTNLFMYKCEPARRSSGIPAYPPSGDRQGYFVDFRETPLHNDTGKISLYLFFDYLAPTVNLLRSQYTKSIFSDGNRNLYLMSLLNMICNLDLQEVIYRSYFKTKYDTLNKPMGTIDEFIRNIFRLFDEKIDENTIIKVSSKLENVSYIIKSLYNELAFVNNTKIENKKHFIGDAKFFHEYADGRVVAVWQNNQPKNADRNTDEKEESQKKSLQNKESKKSPPQESKEKEPQRGTTQSVEDVSNSMSLVDQNDQKQAIENNT